MGRAGSRAGWGSLLSGLASVATLPLAIYFTRFSESYELPHAGFAIPIAAGLGLAALALARKARRRAGFTLGTTSTPMPTRIGRVLGVIGVCMAAAAVVSLAVYGLLEYVGARD